MALSGSVRTNESEGRSVTLNWTATQNIENNTSTISWTLDGSGSAGGWVIVSELKVFIDGRQAYYRDSSQHTECWIGTRLASGSMVVDHNPDGTKYVSMSVQAGIYQWSINTYGNNTFTLNTIPRASTPTLSSASTEMGSAVTINISRASSSFTHTLKYQFGSATGTIGTGIGTVKSWTIPMSLANQIPSATSGYGTITCETYNGSNLIGTKSVNFTATVPSSVVPSISAISLSDPNEYADTYGAYIQNKSKIRVQIAASGSYGSSITKSEITVAGITSTANPYTSNVIVESGGSKTVSVTVTDTRGRTKTSTQTYTVLSYASPTISSLEARRCDSEGNVDDSGEYIKVSFNASITSLDNQNSKSFVISYKKQRNSQYTTHSTQSSAYTWNSMVIIPADIDSTYDIKMSATDSFGETVIQRQVSTAFTLTDFNASGKGIAFGKVSEENAFEVALDIIFTKKIQGLYPIGSIYISVNNTNPSTYFGGTWEQIKDKFLLSAGDTYAGGSTGGEATHTLTIDEMPSHQGHMYDNFNESGYVDRGGDTNSYYVNSSAQGYAQYNNRPYKIVSGNELVMQGYSKGGSQAHNNMPPYLTVYVWKRTS